LIDSLPPEAQAVLREFRTCEFTTLTKDGTPSTWPVSARYLPDEKRFLLTTSIGYPQKAFNIRRNPRVSLLFSNPTASGLTNPPSVLIQGDATAEDKVVTSMNTVNGLRQYWRETIFQRQPATAVISSNPLMRHMMDWYYMRLIIYVVPRAVYWWPAGDFSQPARRTEANHVE
jgi:hypothetical protein